MSFAKDYYSVLGILPGAEQVVVIAAYRALASRYHPDRWQGDIAEATSRMAEINVAYSVIGDVEKRRAHDASRKSTHSSFDPKDDEKEQAFDAALDQMESRWQLAVGIFPDLVDIRKRLAKTAHRLAFAFVTLILEKKLFHHRQAVADDMESAFLELYFGTNLEIILFAKKLILHGHKDAIVALNKLIDVLGNGIDPELIRSKIVKDFHLFPNKNADQKSVFIDKNNLKWQVKEYRDPKDARKLISLMGYRVTTEKNGAGPYIYKAYPTNSTNSNMKTFPNYDLFVKWVVQNFC